MGRSSRLGWKSLNDHLLEKDRPMKRDMDMVKPSASFTFGLLKGWLTSEIRQGLPTLGM